MLRLPGLPIQASEHAGEVDHVMALEHGLILALFVFWASYFIYTLFRFRRGANPTASYVGMRSYWAVYLVFLVAITEAALLVGYEIPAWSNRTRNFPSAEEATVVRVVAQQFAWNIHYPGADRIFGPTNLSLVGPDNPIGLDRTDPTAQDDVVTQNVMAVPADTPVLVRLTSKDVIHSFSVPQMRVKQDAIPGMEIPVWFVPNRIGDYEISCSQLCGLAHFRMRGFLNVRSRADFESFLAEEARAQRP